MIYVVRKQIVAQALARLREQKTHTLFAGYLYLQQRAGQLKRLDDLQPDFRSFFKRFFRVDNHPPGAPYIKLFTEQKPTINNLWLNENVAGSYAPSSLRPEQPFRQVVKIEKRNYSLHPDHATRAFKHLLYSNKINSIDLSLVIYRDYGILSDNPTTSDLIDIFTYEFGYADRSGDPPDKNFDTLFSLDLPKNSECDWFETL